MSINQFFKVLLSGTAILGIVATAQQSQAQSAKFMCQPDNSAVPTTYANTPEGPKPFIKWTSNHFSEASYTPMKRCQEVTEKLNKFNAEGKLDYIVTGWVNGLPVFCATQTCSEENVLLTLKPDQEPNQALEEMKATRAGTSGPTHQSSGADAPMVLNMQQYLDNTPVETPGTAVTAPTTSEDTPNSGALF